MSTIISLNIPPKTENLVHRNQQFSLIFLPETREWMYEIVYHLEPTIFRKTFPTHDKALKAAKSFIEYLKDGPP